MGRKSRTNEYDSVYLLKIFVYLILGSVWIAHGPNGANRIFPLGLVLGILAAQHERLQLDRKIEYAMLVIATIVGLMGIGITIRL